MFTKTSSFFFQEYGDTYSTLPKDAQAFEQIHQTITDKSISTVFYNDEEIYIYVQQGIVMLCISTENKSDSYKQFVIHHTIRLKKHCYFNFFSLSQSAKLTILRKSENHLSIYPLHCEIECQRILPHIQVNEILAYFYQIKSPRYLFTGEQHPYWELTFIDSGTLISEVDDHSYLLHQYDCMLYAPNQFHRQKTDTSTACSYLTIIFELSNCDPTLFSHHIFHASRPIVDTFQQFIAADEKPWSADLCICYLNEILIQLLQMRTLKQAKAAATPLQQKIENELLNEIILFINDHIDDAITIDQLTHQFSISRSSLQLLFNKNLNQAPKQYISHLKLKKAKFLIKENKYSISEISQMLGFTSIHYFSRKFKEEFHLAPSEYAKSIYKQQE